MQTNIISRQKGFSLIELLVVVTIISILSAVAAPIYAEYAMRANVYSAYNSLLAFAQAVINSYEESGGTKWPKPSTGVGAFQNPYLNNGSMRRYPIDYGAGTGVMVTAYMSNKFNISQCEGCQMQIAILWWNNSWNTYCGIWTTTTAGNIPLSWYPPNCNCTDMSAIWGTGYPNTGNGTGTDGC